MTDNTRMVDGVPTLRLERAVECKQGAVRAARFNVDGCYCITSGSDKSVKLWNPYTGVLLHTFQGHGYEVTDARGSSDSSLIASSSLDKTVMLWDVSTGQYRLKLRGHLMRINCVCFTEDSQLVLSGGVDGSVRCWDLRARRNDPIQVLDEAKDSVTSVSVSGHEILSSSMDGNTRLYDVRYGSLSSNCLAGGVTCSTLSGDGQCVLAATVGGHLQLLDKQTGEQLASYSGQTSTDYRVECCFIEGDRHVLSGSEDGYAYSWNLISTKLDYKLAHPGSRVVHSLSPHPSKPHLITATLGQIWLWSPEPTDD